MKRKKKTEEHENHERWLVSYADFITLLFAFFVVMYAISSVNEGKYKTLSSALIDAFKNSPTSVSALTPGLRPSDKPLPEDLNILPQPVPVPVPVPEPIESGDPEQEGVMRGIASEILKVMEPLVKGGHVQVTQSPVGVSIMINAGVLFGPAQAVFEGNSMEALKAVAHVLVKTPNSILVEGHTDNVMINSAVFPSNWELSSARACSVIRLFIDQGVAPERLRAVGYADQRPVASNNTTEGRSRNRRVTLLIEPEAKNPVNKSN